MTKECRSRWCTPALAPAHNPNRGESSVGRRRTGKRTEYRTPNAQRPTRSDDRGAEKERGGPDSRSNARETEAVDESLVEAGFAQRRVVRPETTALVVARNRDDAAVGQYFNDAEIIDNAVVIVLTARRGADVACIRSR